MNSSNRVFITGLGALTACGETANSTWDAILEGKSSIDTISHWDLSSWPYRLGGELKNFQPGKMLPDRKLLKVISRHDIMGINAAMQAIEHSQLLKFRDNLVSTTEFNEKTAILVGSPGNKFYQQYDFLPLTAKTGGTMQEFGKELFSEVHPMWLLRILPNNVLAYTGIIYNFRGMNHNITNHAVSGTQAILEAFYAIQQGHAERAVVIAYDMGIEPQALFYYAKLGLVSKEHLRPFDQSHDGTLLGEGAAALVLESEASAQQRSARCYAEILGGNSSSEASGLFSIEENGAHLTANLTQLLSESQINPTEIGMVVAHGNGNPKSDNTEAEAILNVFGEKAVPVTAFKWAMGHTLCASGILDTVLATYALNHQCIPGIANLHQAADECSHLNSATEHRSLAPNKKSAVIINRGFASMNACLVIKTCD